MGVTSPCVRVFGNKTCKLRTNFNDRRRLTRHHTTKVFLTIQKTTDPSTILPMAALKTWLMSSKRLIAHSRYQLTILDDEITAHKSTITDTLANLGVDESERNYYAAMAEQIIKQAERLVRCLPRQPQNSYNPHRVIQTVEESATSRARLTSDCREIINPAVANLMRALYLQWKGTFDLEVYVRQDKRLRDTSKMEEYENAFKACPWC